MCHHRGALAKSSKRRHVVNVGVCNVHFHNLLPYATLVWVGKSAFIAFIIVCVQAPQDGKGGAPVVRAAGPGSRNQGFGVKARLLAGPLPCSRTGPTSRAVSV